MHTTRSLVSIAVFAILAIMPVGAAYAWPTQSRRAELCLGLQAGLATE